MCKSNEAEVLSRWTDHPAYTQFVREVLLRDGAKTLQTQYYGGEFWGLDAVMYYAKDCDNFLPNMTYPYSICVALEHENDANKSMEEINKLQHFKAPLKVLVTYPKVRKWPSPC